MADSDRLLARAETLLERLEALLPDIGAPADWSATAYRWRRRLGRGRLEPVAHPHRLLPEPTVRGPTSSSSGATTSANPTSAPITSG